MNAGAPAFAGIRFLASELILSTQETGRAGPEKGCRFDMVGYRDRTVWLFELKRDRDTGVYSQIVRYKAHFEANRGLFSQVLAAYPRTACPEAVEPEAIRYIVVEQEGAAAAAEGRRYAGEAGVDTWLFSRDTGSGVLRFETISGGEG